MHKTSQIPTSPHGYPHPIVTVDVVLLTLKDGELLTALVQRQKPPQEGVWTIPGGWVHTETDEDVLDAAFRILKVKAGIESPYLEQLWTFSGRHRDSRGWSVSVAHYALIPSERVGDAGKVHWRAVDTIRSLPFDHLNMVRTAVERVRSKTLYSSLPLHLMPPVFTLSQLQGVYEQLLGAQLDKRSFRRRIEELDVVEKAPTPRGASPEGAGRPAQHYQLKRHRALVLADKNLGTKD